MLNRSVLWATVLCVFGLASMLSTSFATDVEAETSKAIQVPQNLQEVLQENGTARVIIGLKVDFKAEGTLLAEKVTEQRVKIARVQEQFLNGLKEVLQSPLQEHKYAAIPYVVIDVNQAALQYIVQEPLVTSIELDALMAPLSGGF